jgi:hypothetical protein
VIVNFSVIKSELIDKNKEGYVEGKSIINKTKQNKTKSSLIKKKEAFFVYRIINNNRSLIMS